VSVCTLSVQPCSSPYVHAFAHCSPRQALYRVPLVPPPRPYAHALPPTGQPLHDLPVLSRGPSRGPRCTRAPTAQTPRQGCRIASAGASTVLMQSGACGQAGACGGGQARPSSCTCCRCLRGPRRVCGQHSMGSQGGQRPLAGSSLHALAHRMQCRRCSLVSPRSTTIAR